ncbi:MAG TPA: transporter substrate-binding domain-containing protein [Polyangiaceae bacterium]|nr:transporter substrate-binding domain-containing protein [Polyangiaceae bacterium]
MSRAYERRFSLGLAIGSLALVVFAASCAPAPRASTPPASTPDAVGARSPDKPTLRVGTSADYAPFASRDAAGHLQGFDAELAERLAADLGFELQWVTFRWPELEAQLKSSAFDVAMSGVTWQPLRAVTGYLTRSVARGGPCLLGDAAAPRVAVNHGGVLEAWARQHLTDRELVTVDDNQSLPELLASARVGAIVTDSFELKAFQRPNWAVHCEPALARKVYWVSPAHLELGERIDAWLRANEARVEAAQLRWFGAEQALGALPNLVDLLARRMAFMPLVAGIKSQQGLPIEDLAREAVVLEGVQKRALELGLPKAPARAFFALQIELSKAVERRSREASSLDLRTQIRPALDQLGERILAALVESRSAGVLQSCTLGDLQLLSPWLTEAEQLELLEKLRALDG